MAVDSFIVHCHKCRAKVAAEQLGIAETSVFDEEASDYSGTRVHLGKCHSCGSILVGESNLIGLMNFDADEDTWSDVVHVYPKPSKRFRSPRIPAVVTSSLEEADRCLQTNASVAACAMLGRALEGVCRDLLKPGKTLMLAKGIAELKKNGHIDERLFRWSKDLHAFRNLAAHAEATPISRQDAEDLQSFVLAIVEYVYDLEELYQRFESRQHNKKKVARDVRK